MSSQEVNAEIISIGTEILLGELTDTNSVHIAQVLRRLGINLYMMASVGDNRKRIAQAIGNAMQRADLVITCGGLGPTVDDMTREAVADATERGLTFHQHLYEQIAERFRGFGVNMTDNNRQQAFLPDGAIEIPNPVGTAPCFIVEHNGRLVISLPGVPREMKFLLEDQVVPFLRQRFQLGIIKARTLKTAGIGESALDDLLGRSLLEQVNPTVGLNAHMGQIDVRITAKADTEPEADTMIAETEAVIRARAGRFIFGAGDDVLEQVLVDLLAQMAVKVAIIQAGVGDVLVGPLSEQPDGLHVVASDDRYASPAEMAEALGLDRTKSHREWVREVAERTRDTAGIALVLVASSDPDVEEGQDVEQATVIAVCTADRYRDRVYGFGARSQFSRTWGKSWLLSTAWHQLQEEGLP